MLQKRTKADYVVSKWSGGTTTQLAIFPPTAYYADRDFLWRVSSATVDLEESDFTPLPDYDRLIATLEGGIELTHNGGPTLTLRPLEVHAFSGGDVTHSRGRCRDFNLMLRRGRVTGTMEVLHLSAAPTNLSVGTSIACPPPPAPEQVLLYCVEGPAYVGAAIGRPPEAISSDPYAGTGIACPPSLHLLPGESILLSAPDALTLTGPAVLMLCRIKSQDGEQS